LRVADENEIGKTINEQGSVMNHGRMVPTMLGQRDTMQQDAMQQGVVMKVRGGVES
jgi:hypothetical protein